MSDNKPIIVGLIIVAVLLVGALAYLFSAQEQPKPVATQPVEVPRQAPASQPAPETPAPETVVPAPASESEPASVPVAPAQSERPALVLPRLDDSDQLIRDGVVSLTRNEGINAWLGANELIRKCVVFIDNIAHGNVARREVPFLAPDAPFSARQISEKEFVLDDASYQRYDLVTNILVSIDSHRAAEFYELLKPLFQEAYTELGYPDGNFDEVIFKAIGRLLETPVIDRPIRLVRPVVMFRYEDPKLETLSAAQKQLIRMGPQNTRAIQAKLGEMARELRVALKK